MVEDSHYEEEGRGRSKKKKAALAVEALAVRMVASSDAVCKSLPLTDELREDLDKARKITARTARKRQLKHLASLMRRDEEAVAAIESALDSFGRSSRAERDFFHQIEEIRDALCDSDQFDEAIEKAAGEFPDLDRQKFTRLARRFHETGDKRASREIFRKLRALTEGPSGT